MVFMYLWVRENLQRILKDSGRKGYKFFEDFPFSVLNIIIFIMTDAHIIFSCLNVPCAYLYLCTINGKQIT